MNILLCGDVVARSGRDAVEKYMPSVKREYEIDFTVIDVDNAAHGFGITRDIAKWFFNLGADILTGGNHLFDQKEVLSFLNQEKRLLRPLNMPTHTPGYGISETIVNGKMVVVVHMLGQKNMPNIGNDPFEMMNNVLAKYVLGKTANVIIVDFHAEVTSEKNALGHFLDGRVSAVVGTHTHIPTADGRILANGTAFQTDLGMCGDYDSVIGMQKYSIIDRFVKNYNSARITSSAGDGSFCGLVVNIDDSTGLAKKVTQIKLGGSL